MMPTFPSPPLKFRTAGFPRYGLKAGISDEAFPATGFAIVLRALSASIGISLLSVRVDGAYQAPPRERYSALPQGPSLRSGLCCPGPSSLNWPHPPHSQAHPDFAASRFIRDIFAVPDLHRPRRPASGSELSSMLFRNMSSSTTTGNSSAACTQYFTEDPSLQLRMTVSAFPSPSHSDPSKGVSFRGLTTVRLRYDLLFCLPSLSEQTRFASSHREGVYFRASDGLVTRPVAGYHYRANWAICTGGTCTR